MKDLPPTHAIRWSLDDYTWQLADGLRRGAERDIGVTMTVSAFLLGLLRQAVKTKAEAAGGLDDLLRRELVDKA